MAGFRLTQAAKRDLVEIAQHPNLGLPSDTIKPGYWRSHEGRHVIFYRVTGRGVEIVRVLHDRMVPTRHM
jgi:toxin ParE1/3/4